MKTTAEKLQGISLVKRPLLRKGQKSLFDLICVKLKTGDNLTLEETKNIYVKTACRNFVENKPATYNYYYNPIRKEKDGRITSWQGRYEIMTDQYLNRMVLMWLTHNIGMLVLKGYLKVLPVIEFQ